MKKLHYTLLFLLIPFFAFAQEETKLPAQPWVELIQMDIFNKKNLPKKVYKNIKINVFDTLNIKLLGNYTLSDSTEVANAIRKLNIITETLDIKFSNIEESNFRISFLDTIKRDKKTGHILAGGNSKKNNSVYEMYVYNTINNENISQKHEYSLELKIARWLVNGYFKERYDNENQFSIFSLSQPLKSYSPSLNIGDQEIISSVYKKGFKERLKLAKKQFKDIPKKIDRKKISDRDRTLWWVRNPIAVMFLPFLVLILFSLFTIGKTNNFLKNKIKNDLLKFTLIALLSFVFLYFIIIFYYHFYHFLKIPEHYRSVRIWDIEIALSLLIIFPFLFVFRFIELKIQKSFKDIYFKTGLIFLSTVFVPFVCLTLIFLMNIDSIPHIQERYYTLSKLFLILMSIAIFRALISYFIFKERNLIVENENKLSHLRELKTKAELKSLQSQINPHFLYNSLNSIASLAPINAEKSQKMAHSLSDLFKYSINRKGQKMSTIKDEIEMVKAYLEIEKIRFEERLNFTIKVDETLLNHKIPLFLIQPLVENAIKHGVSKNKDKGEVVLNIEKERNTILITVTDNGPDFPEGLVSGHGLQTVYDLLRLSYGDKAALNWTNSPQKIITITIPKTA